MGAGEPSPRVSEGDRFDDEPLIASSLSLDLSGSGTRSAAAESGLAIRPEKVPVPTRTLTCMGGMECSGFKLGGIGILRMRV